MVDSAFKHSQSTSLSAHRAVAQVLRRAGLLDSPFAASAWHGGLNIAYAGEAVRLYLGQPLAEDRDARARELQRAGALTYIQFLRQSDAAGGSVLPDAWKRVLSLPQPNQRRIDVYVLAQ